MDNIERDDKSNVGESFSPKDNISCINITWVFLDSLPTYLVFIKGLLALNEFITLRISNSEIFLLIKNSKLSLNTTRLFSSFAISRNLKVTDLNLKTPFITLLLSFYSLSPSSEVTTKSLTEFIFCRFSITLERILWPCL